MMKSKNAPPAVALWAVVAVIATALAAPAAAQLNQPLHRDGWLLAAAHAPGKNGSIWRTDLWVVAPDTATVTLYFCKADQDNSGARGFQLTAVAGQRVYYVEDVVDHFLDLQGGSWLGAIHYTASSDVQVWARVYSISPDGTASYGQLVEGIPTVDMSPDNDPWNSHDPQRVIAARHTADGRFRVNVGIVNPTAIASTYSLRMYNADGNGGTSTSWEVPAYSMKQLLDPFAGFDGGEWSDKTIRVVCETEGGGAFAYASTVDNATNDAFFARGVK